MPASSRETPCRNFGPEHAASCRFAMFDRQGGVSGGPFASLNSSFTVGDAHSAVAANRERIKEIMAVSLLVSARQVHGDKVYHLDSSPREDLEVDGYDALITDQPEIGIMVQHADCQAVLLFDPRQRVAAAVHCGWRGSVLDILGKTVQVFADLYNSRPGNLLAAVSPSLGPCCSEFVNHRDELPASFLRFRTAENHFDFWSISRAQLIAAGLLPSSISIAKICTSCSPDYFSYRRARRHGDGITGRNCTVICVGNEKTVKEWRRV